MGDQDDDREDYRLEDILAFDEKDLGEYTADVQRFVEAGRRLTSKELKVLCADNKVVQSELRQAGSHPTWTKARMMRDLMVQGVALESGEQVVPDDVVPNRWKEPSAEGSDSDDGAVAQGPGGDARDQSLLSPAGSLKWQAGEATSAPIMMKDSGGDAGSRPLLSPGAGEAASAQQLMALVQRLQSRLEDQEQRSKRLDLEVIRLRASKSEPAREYGIGLESVPLRSESRELLWRSTTNAFETKSLTSKEYQELVKSNSSDELDWYQRPGMSSEVAKFANKTEFSLKYIWDNHTKKMVSRLESVITTLVTAHTHVENAQDGAYVMSQPTITWTDSKGAEQQHTLPPELRAKIRQVEDDVDAARGRVVAAVRLVQSESARLCGETQAAIVKKMSVGASQQLTISKLEEKNKTASMLTPALIATLEKQRQEQKALTHALDAKSRPTSKYQGKGAGRPNRPPKKGGGKPKQSPRSPARPQRSPEKGPNSPRPEPKGKGKGGAKN